MCINNDRNISVERVTDLLNDSAVLNLFVIASSTIVFLHCSRRLFSVLSFPSLPQH